MKYNSRYDGKELETQKKSNEIFEKQLTLLSVGYGGAETLSLEQRDVLDKADCVMYGDLCNPNLLNSCTCKTIEIKSQDDVLLMFKLYNNIVKLVRGDFAFWSTFQELKDICLANNITVKFIGGKSQFDYIASKIQREFTINGINSSFLIVKQKIGNLYNKDILKFAQLNVPMAITRVESVQVLASQLNNFDKQLPAIFCYDIGLSNEEFVVTTIKDLTKQNKKYETLTVLVGNVFVDL